MHHSHASGRSAALNYTTALVNLQQCTVASMLTVCIVDLSCTPATRMRVIEVVPHIIAMRLA